MIKITNLKKYFGNTLALDIPSLHLSCTGIISLFGNNGAGKTTFLRIVADLLKPNSGVVEYFSNEKFNPTKVASYLDESFLIEYLTVEEYCQLVILINKLDKSNFIDRLNQCISFFNYEKYKRSLLSELSTGNRNKVGILSAILQNKPITLLDEPFANIDPTSQLVLCKILEEMKQYDRIVVLSSHSIETLLPISERVLLLDNGKIISNLGPGENRLSIIHEFFRSGLIRAC
ncbi:MAG: ABC transporter ATP-binding protein [Chitinophagaceae bacterium]|nr:ABC transporter ATP-binding protein [Chitinophagaceae bacterium]MCW5929821.1 ABC transporter ATP-binding protein [Chitinophagaceae bacterium]